MQNHKWLKVFNEYVKETEDLESHRSDVMLEICKIFFAKKYGIELLNLMGMQIKDFVKKRSKWSENVDIEDFNFTIFSQLYENFLSSTNREKTGSFYTPYYIIDYMVERSLEIYLSRETGYTETLLWRCFHENKVLNQVQLKIILEKMDSIRIVDIACGTGLFLIRYFEKLFKYKKIIYKMQRKKINDFMIKKYIIENNLFGIDIQEKPIKIAKMVLLSLTYGTDKSQYTDKICLNIKAGNSLMDEMIFEKDTFKKVIKDEGGFDIVIGNPPYLGEKGNKHIFDKIKGTHFGKKYYEGKMDYFYFFIYKALEILKENGILSYITTNYFITADGAAKLRKFLRNNATFIDIVNFNDYEIFKSAKGQHNILFFLSKGADQTQSVKIKYIKERDIDKEEMHELLRENKKRTKKIYQYTLPRQQNLYGPNGHILIQENNQYDYILKKIYENSQYTLKELCNINQGVVSGADKITKDILEKKISLEYAKEKNIILYQGIFVLSEKEVNELGFLELPYIKPMYKNSDIQRYFCSNEASKYLLYISDKIFTETELDNRILEHLSKYKEILEKRRETIRGIRPWYALQWPRKQEIFENTKIVVPHRAKENKFALNNSSWYASADVYFITAKRRKINWNLLLGILNSKIMYFWLYNRGKRKGDYLELYANPLKNLPIMWNIDEDTCNKITSFVEQMINRGEDPKLQELVDKTLYNVYNLTSTEIRIIEDFHKRNLGK
ncbi:hypothetical protein FQB35_08345 [Crassaminicella thermophila]|uniref:site-specific DNA-methyltransferase (adenine-specific) n=1 Tax=Crassaminicella thermophila TaxID=2599308 RepID=A0A5C0SG78_CRATE|nr:DNA methyltransferase [Crassaminicella thermophila]QEK12384.1 hypothetical protein FQB35_08345 [Crassaminicella thermophila]